MPRHPRFKPPVAELILEDPIEAMKADLAARLLRFLGTAQSVEEYVGSTPTMHHPNGYRFKKITHREAVQAIAVNQ